MARELGQRLGLKNYFPWKDSIEYTMHRVKAAGLSCEELRETGVALPPAPHSNSWCADPPRPGDVRDSVACLDRARDLLGYAPGVGLDEGLRRTVESFKAKGGAA